MKKIIYAVLLCGLLLAGCGNNISSSGKPTSSVISAVKDTESTPLNKPAESKTEPHEEKSEESSKSEYYFSNGVLQSEDVKIVITDYKIVEAGAEGNELGEKPAIVFYYDITNLTGNESVTAATGWMAMFDAIQDNDPNNVNTLDVGWYFDAANTIDGYATIKKDGTVSYYMSYELDDDTTPVVLKASRGIGGEFLGEQSYDIAG